MFYKLIRGDYLGLTLHVYALMFIRSKNKEIEADEEPPRDVLWVKGRQNKDGECTDVEISSLADKLVNLTADSIIMLKYQQQ